MSRLASTSAIPLFPSRAHRARRRTRRSAPNIPCSCAGWLALLALSASANVATATLDRTTSPSHGLAFSTSPLQAWGLQARAAVLVPSASAASETTTKTRLSTTVVELVSSSEMSVGAVATVTVSSFASSASVVGASATRTSSGAVSTSTVVPASYTIPQPFDTNLGVDFTSTACPSFFETFLADPAFISCVPFSLLLSTSSAFFTAERSPYSLLPYILNASCASDESACTAHMASLAAQIQLPSTCGADLAAGNSFALTALQGFQNYEMQRTVGCQTDNSTGKYCFAEAAAQVPASDIYWYYLPQGTSLPSGTVSDCGSCTQNLLGIYSTYAANGTLLISKTYAAARTVAALTCGPAFAPLVVAATRTGLAAPTLRLINSRFLLTTLLTLAGLATLA